MKLLLRSLGRPVPEEVDVEGNENLETLLAIIGAPRSDTDCGDTERPLRLVHRGRVLRGNGAKLSDLCCDGDVLVVLPGRLVAPPLPAPLQPSKGPTMREINAAILEELAAQGPGTLAAAEAAAAQQEEEAASAARAPTGTAALEQALLTGEMGALRSYLQRLQDELRDPGGAAAAGAGGGEEGDFELGGLGGGALGGGALGGGGADGAGGVTAVGTALAALEAFMALAAQNQDTGGGGGGGNAAAAAAVAALGGAAAAHGGAEETDEEDGEAFSDEEEEEEEEEEEFTEEEEEEEEDEEEEGPHDELGAGAQLPPPQVPQLDEAALASLQEMGFPDPLCRNALLMGRNRFEPALEWLLAHVDDPQAAQPLSDFQLAVIYGRRGPGQAARQSQPAAVVQVDAGHLAHLTDMGFDAAAAEQALRAFNNSLPAAASWLLSLGTGATAVAPAAGAADAPAAGDGQQQQQDEQQQEEEEQEEASDGGWATDSDGSHAELASHSGSEDGSEDSSGEGSEEGTSAGEVEGQNDEEDEEEEPMPELGSESGAGSSSSGGSEGGSGGGQQMRARGRDDPSSGGMPVLARSGGSSSRDAERVSRGEEAREAVGAERPPELGAALEGSGSGGEAQDSGALPAVPARQQVRLDDDGDEMPELLEHSGGESDANS